MRWLQVAVWLAAAGSAMAQTPHTPIASFKNFPRDTYQDLWDQQQPYPLVGRVTTPYLNAANEMVEFFLEDDSGGIRVRGAADGLFLSRIPNAPQNIEGLYLQVDYYVRLIEDDNGELIAEMQRPRDSLTIMTPPDPPEPLTPQSAGGSAIAAGYFDGQLVKIEGVTATSLFSWPHGQDNHNGVILTGDETELGIFIDKDTELAGMPPPPPGVPFDITGIIIPHQLGGDEDDGDGGASSEGETMRFIMPRSLADLDVPEVPNEPPTISAPERVIAAPGVQLAFEVTAEDPNIQDALVFSVSNAASQVTFTNISARIARFGWKPAVADIGEHTVYFQVSDGIETAVTSTVIEVTQLSGGPDHPWINEIHYDNVGTDVNEGFELAGRADIALTNYFVCAYTNSSPGRPALLHKTIACDGTIPDETGTGYGAVWFSVSLNNAGTDARPSTAGLALIYVDPQDTATTNVQQFISYEGFFTAANGPAAGRTSQDIRREENGFTPVGRSLYLIGNGSDYPEAKYEEFTWTGPGLSTPGSINGGQRFGGVSGRATLDVSKPMTDPGNPDDSESIHVVATYLRSFEAQYSSATLHYSIDGWQTTNTIAMTRESENDQQGLLRTSEPIPAQPLGTTLALYVEVAFTGNQADSPAVSPLAETVIRKLIAFQGFENSQDDTWVYTATPNGAAIRTIGAPSYEGSRALAISGQMKDTQPGYVQFRNQHIEGFNNVVFSIAYAAQDVDTGDELLLELSYDGGITWGTSVVLASGYGDGSFNFGDTPQSPNGPITQPSNPFLVNIPDGITQVLPRITHRGASSKNNPDDYYYIDSVSLAATAGELVPLPPSFDLGDTAWTAEALQTNVFTISAYHPNGEPVILSLQNQNLPDGLSFSTSQANGTYLGQITFIPDVSMVSSNYPLTFVATDAYNRIATLEASILVTEPFTGFIWDFDDGTDQGWKMQQGAYSGINEWPWDVYPNQNGYPLYSGPKIGAENSSHYAGINGYSAEDPQLLNLWWISPAVDCSHMKTPKLRFAAWANHGGPNLMMHATTNINAAVGSPDWAQLGEVEVASQKVWRFIEQELDGWTNVPFRIAFQYIGTGYADGSRCWAVDSISITDEPLEPRIEGEGPLIISEYGEGTGNNKYLELFNLSHTNVNLSSYQIKLERSGSGGYGSALQLSGTLPPRSTYVLVNNSATSQYLKDLANRTVGGAPLDFNGDDAVGLFYNGNLADAVGRLGDTSMWGENCGLIRKESVQSPTPVYDDSEWIRVSVDDWSDVGHHADSGEQPGIPPPPSGLTLSAATTTGFTISWNAVPEATEYLVDIATNPTFSGIPPELHDISVMTTSTTISLLAHETQYWVRVRTRTAEYDSLYSAAQSITTLPALLMLSEYGEGGANNNMYIEIHNPHAFAVSLDGYALRKKTTNLLPNFGAPLALSGTLTAGTTFVVAHEQASAELRSMADLTTAHDALNFNGYHAVGLFRGDALVDVIGQPGAPWGVDKTFARLPAITSPNSVYTPAEWFELPVDDWSNVGRRGAEPEEPDTPVIIPEIVGIELTPSGAVVRLRATPELEAGVSYLLQRAETPSTREQGWTTLTGEATALDAATATLTDPSPPPAGAFYRIIATR